MLGLVDVRKVYTLGTMCVLLTLRWLGREKSYLGIVIGLLNLGEGGARAKRT